MKLTSALSCFEIFAGSSYRGSICPTGEKIGSSYREFREIEGSRNPGLNYRARVKKIQGKQGLVRDIGRFEKPRQGSRNWDSTVFIKF